MNASNASQTNTKAAAIKPAGLAMLDLQEAPSFDRISSCVHCGLCLEACPTYQELRVEMDSPRGRIYLMKGLLNGRLEPSEKVFQHLDRCLDCRACETACPSGVPYSDILERTRTVMLPLRQEGIVGRALRKFVFYWLLPSRAVQDIVFRLLWLGQILGLSALGRRMAFWGLVPGRLGKAMAQTPYVPAQSFRRANRGQRDDHRGVTFFPALGKQTHMVALFTGCLADRLFSDVNRDTVDVLTRNGCRVEILDDEGCCGALHIHNAQRDKAKVMAAHNVDAFAHNNYDAIISNAAGCSAELRHYDGLLQGHPSLAPGKSQTFSGKIRDIFEFLLEIQWQPPKGNQQGHAPEKIILTYDDPCHLLHAQKIAKAPRDVLDALPAFTRVELKASDVCCGSAGVYSVLQPVLASAITNRKIDNILQTRASVVATGNPGCMMQIAAALNNQGHSIRVAHPISLVAEAYRAAES